MFGWKETTSEGKFELRIEFGSGVYENWRMGDKLLESMEKCGQIFACRSGVGVPSSSDYLARSVLRMREKSQVTSTETGRRYLRRDSVVEWRMS